MPATRLRPRITLAITVAAIYLPGVIGFFSDCDHCRKVWIHLFPALPGILPTHLITRWLGLGRLDETIMVILATSLSLVLIGLICWVGRRGLGWLIASLVAGHLYSLYASTALMAAVRS